MSTSTPPNKGLNIASRIENVKESLARRKARKEGIARAKCEALLEQIKQAEASGDNKKALKLCQGSRLRSKGALGLAKKHAPVFRPYLEQKAVDLKGKLAEQKKADLESKKKEKELGIFEGIVNEHIADGEDEKVLDELLGKKKDDGKKEPEKKPSSKKVKGMDYFALNVKSQTASEGPLYESVLNISILIMLLHDHYRTKGTYRDVQSLLEYMNLDCNNLVEMLQAVLGNIRGGAIEKDSIAKWINQESVNSVKMVYKNAANLDDEVDSKEVDELMKSLNELMGKLKDWRSFCSSKSTFENPVNVSLQIKRTLSSLKESFNKKDYDTRKDLLEERNGILSNANLPVFQNKKSFDLKKISALLKQLERQELDTFDQDVEKLRNSDDRYFQEALHTLCNEVEYAFREVDENKYDTDHSQFFGGQKLIELVREINRRCAEANVRDPNTKIPKFFGTFLVSLSNPDAESDLLKAMGNKFNVKDPNALSQMVKEIYQMFCEISPVLKERNPYYKQSQEEALEADERDLFAAFS